MLTRQMLTRQMLTTLMEKETFAHNFFIIFIYEEKPTAPGK